MKTIKVNAVLEKRIVAFCTDELNYHVNESGCADEYHDEILAQIELLYHLDYKRDAAMYEVQYKHVLTEMLLDEEDTRVKAYLKALHNDLTKLWAELQKGKNDEKN